MGKESLDLGREGEDLAERYLRQLGYTIIERNFHSQHGEIDLIARIDETLIFVEVKNYSYRSFNPPCAAISRSKKQSLIHAARTYLYKRGIKGTNCRFDVLTIYRNQSNQCKVEHFQNAFFIN